MILNFELIARTNNIIPKKLFSSLAVHYVFYGLLYNKKNRILIVNIFQLEMDEENKRIVKEGWSNLSDEIGLIEETLEDDSHKQYPLNQAIKHYQLTYDLFVFFLNPQVLNNIYSNFLLPFFFRCTRHDGNTFIAKQLMTRIKSYCTDIIGKKITSLSGIALLKELAKRWDRFKTYVKTLTFIYLQLVCLQ